MTIAGMDEQLHARVEAAVNELESQIRTLIALRSEPDWANVAAELGRRGGKAGAKALYAKLTPEQRSDKARKAAQARWGKPDPPPRARFDRYRRRIDGEGVCSVCSLAVGLQWRGTRTARSLYTVEHYPSDIALSHSGHDRSFCRGSSERPVSVLSMKDSA